ncbi:hypothetical protein BDZ85DRAFT_59445 [Elsinoe ampelina]|uniref:Secreted protein n=1 Tax=Elsinoe ampelina TaxID=302913 RepID=A0A6A6G0F7_9PEZI|nr:hypothetical protein BDZ85DRAFT_59445 [Elsinoe ampelina]
MHATTTTSLAPSFLLLETHTSGAAAPHPHSQAVECRFLAATLRLCVSRQTPQTRSFPSLEYGPSIDPRTEGSLRSGLLTPL